jgi:pimeloyl-ACP methyl ester carboxylesterase
MTRRGGFFIALAIVVSFLLGMLAHKGLPALSRSLLLQETPFRWSEGFSIVEIESSLDQTRQRAIFHPAAGAIKRPLLVSLHFWSGNYASSDSLAQLADKEDWNYIHPDFRGPNRATDNCLSDKVVGDIDDAIAYGMRAGNVDPEQILVVGFSGGAYAALGMYARTRHRVRAFLAWAPISDLGAWHDESTARGDIDIARQIRQCTGSAEQLNDEAARLRSPLYWTLPETPKARIEIFAGINDGYSGTVPISHSIRFFNRLADTYGSPEHLVTTEEISALLSRGLRPQPGMAQVAGRTLLFQRNAVFGSLTVFQGGHEMPPAFCFARLQSLVKRVPGVEGHRSGG